MSTRARPSRAAAAPSVPAVLYRVAVQSTQAHLFAVTLTIARPAARQRLALPVWIPGSYMIREFAQHLQHLQATQGGEPVPLRQLNKNSWQADADPAQPLTLSYEVYAFDASVRTAFLDSTRGFFNATSLCLRVIGQEEQPQTLDIAADGLPEGWQVATGLRAVAVDAAGVGRYEAAHYDELADGPVELGTFWSGSFEACGVPHRFVVSGAGAWFDGAQEVAGNEQVQKIIETFAGRGTLADDTPPTPDFTGWQTPLGPNALNTATVQLHGIDLCMESISIDLANQLVFRDLPGCDPKALITDRKPTGSVSFEATTVAAKDWWTISKNNTLGALQLIHGTADGFKVQIDAPKV